MIGLLMDLKNIEKIYISEATPYLEVAAMCASCHVKLFTKLKAFGRRKGINRIALNRLT